MEEQIKQLDCNFDQCLYTKTEVLIDWGVASSSSEFSCLHAMI